MRNYVLTDAEKHKVLLFLEKDVRLDQFNILLGRIRKAHPRLQDDMKLIEKLLEKLESKGRRG